MKFSREAAQWKLSWVIPPSHTLPPFLKNFIKERASCLCRDWHKTLCVPGDHGEPGRLERVGAAERRIDDRSPVQLSDSTDISSHTFAKPFPPFSKFYRLVTRTDPLRLNETFRRIEASCARPWAERSASEGSRRRSRGVTRQRCRSHSYLFLKKRCAQS